VAVGADGEVADGVTRPRSLVVEEGPLAGWLWRGLVTAVERMVVSEPRRNRLIAKGGDKDDDLDAEKLAQLDRCMGDAIAREPKRKRPNPNRDRTEVCDLIPVRFLGMTPVSDGDKKRPLGG